MSLNSLRFFHLRILLGRAKPDRAGARPIGDGFILNGAILLCLKFISVTQYQALVRKSFYPNC